jgi:hypothetical protein
VSLGNFREFSRNDDACAKKCKLNEFTLPKF